MTQPIDSLAIARNFFYDEPLPTVKGLLSTAMYLAPHKAHEIFADALAETSAALDATPICAACVKYAANPGGPSHDGSPGCRSGSIASGGKRAHCSCSLCF